MTEKSSNTLNITFKNAEGVEIHFKINKDTKLTKAIDAYCERNGIDKKSLRFIYDGKRISGDETAKSLEMENDDIIDVLSEQVGG